MKFFIITVDTEGDNLWRYKKGEEIGVRNASFIPRFQHLCNKYNLKPVYLTNYEMANNDIFVQEAREWLKKGLCEIGIHLHAWNNPPYYDLHGDYDGNPYLIEYPDEVMNAKFQYLYNLIYENFGVKPVSHRAGRWVMDERYFNTLRIFNIKVDCSVTPGINWENTKGETRCGCNYSDCSYYSHDINGVLEVPMSIFKIRCCKNGSWKRQLYSLLFKQTIWLRPATTSLKGMKQIVNKVEKDEKLNYIEFMVHSSELMPDGSPYFKTKNDVENLYIKMEQLFDYIRKKGYTGVTLEEYYKIQKGL